MTRRGTRILWAVALTLAAGGGAQAGEPASKTEVILRVKPAVVLVVTEVAGTVRLTCPAKGGQELAVPPVQAHGSGFLISPDGYLVTSGHVVQPYAEEDPETREAFIRQAIEQRCLEASPPGATRRAAVQGLFARIAPSARIDWKKSLTVVLSNRERFTAEVKAYSPALREQPGRQIAADTGQVAESGKDVAILKIDGATLPTIPFGDSDRVQVGQPLEILGYPGVVLYHELLDKRSAVEASVTTGQVSSLRRDARGTPVIQTDAAASWGNSGGPAVNDRGEVVGLLTFISLTPDQTQAIQGFNFLVPAKIAQEFARAAGAPLGAASPFNALWHDAVARYVRGDYAGALPRLDAANRLVPNLSDLQRLQADAQLQVLRAPSWPWTFTLGGVVLVVAVSAVPIWILLRRRRGRRAPAAGLRAEAETSSPPEARSPVRVSPGDLARAFAQRVDLLLVDVRSPAAYEASPLQAKGAIRASADDILRACRDFPKSQGLALYCDSPGEALSARAASALMAENFTRVMVLAGGFEAWLQGNLPLERTPHARTGLETRAIPALPAAPPGTQPPLQGRNPVDLSLGVKGSGPYFNATATSFGMTGLSFATTQELPLGQRLQLTVFTEGDALELRGVVEAIHAEDGASGGSPGSTMTVEVRLDPLPEETATALEGLILSRRTRQSTTLSRE